MRTDTLRDFLPSAKFQEAARKIAKEATALQDKLTEEQLASAFTQAVACGDFTKLVTPTRTTCVDDRFNLEIRQGVLYLPYDGYERECRKFERYRETVAGILTPEQKVQLENLLEARHEE